MAQQMPRLSSPRAPALLELENRKGRGHVRPAQDPRCLHRRSEYSHVRVVGLQDLGAAYSGAWLVGDAEPADIDPPEHRAPHSGGCGVDLRKESESGA